MPEFIQTWDMQIVNWMAQNQNPILTLIAAILSLLSAKAATVWLLIPVLWFRRFKALAFRIFMALSTSAILGMLIKPIFARQRPSVVAAQLAHKPIPEFLTTHYSFPSGHVLLWATTAFVVSRCCKPRTTTLIWTFTLLVCWARIYDKMHFPTVSLG